ncbi:diaminopimelate epimerase [Rossellomorea sp. YZS02]|uniref:diaminopimelate epimerase n=1 Tax=Rossellomorea sp. YZS02 TaxID=3097358 RepID=UPI002A148AFF|nr:diaminopimelate epimerase [Rossellomorea sp. YZS02]MDX8343747.1 diaminopimelate epimerase [Rossellomorea sp. YZS02]
MDLNLIKCHGSGNDFLLIDEMTNGYDFTDEARQNLALALCDRRSSLGADGILFVLASENCDARMRVFNADGSEASMCGNGLRCVGRYVCELLDKESIIIQTMKANLRVSSQESIFENIPTYNVEISPVLFGLNQLPMNMDRETLLNESIPEISDRLTFSALAVPNPHLISVVGTEHILSNEQKNISETVNGPNNLFPDGVNVSFVHPLEKGSIYVRTFERGVGFTNACGTAMSASSLVTCLLEQNEFGKEIEVYNNGGKVRVIVNQLGEGQYNMELIGNATYLYQSQIELSISHPEDFHEVSRQAFTEEATYELLQNHAKSIVESKVFMSA